MWCSVNSPGRGGGLVGVLTAGKSMKARRKCRAQPQTMKIMLVKTVSTGMGCSEQCKFWGRVEPAMSVCCPCRSMPMPHALNFRTQRSV